MIEHEDNLWRVETTSEDLQYFYVLAGTLHEALCLAESHCADLKGDPEVVAVKLARGPLVVDDEDDEGDEVEEEPVVSVGEKVPQVETLRARRN